MRYGEAVEGEAAEWWRGWSDLVSAVSATSSLFKEGLEHHCFRNKVFCAVSTDIKTWPCRKGISEISLMFPFDALCSWANSPHICAVTPQGSPSPSPAFRKRRGNEDVLLKSLKPALDNWKAWRALPILAFSLPFFPSSALSPHRRLRQEQEQEPEQEQEQGCTVHRASPVQCCRLAPRLPSSFPLRLRGQLGPCL